MTLARSLARLRAYTIRSFPSSLAPIPTQGRRRIIKLKFAAVIFPPAPV